MTLKVALITGVTGQDGSYLAELLLAKGYEVHGLIRRASTFNTSRIDHIYQDPHDPSPKLNLHYGDLTDGVGLTNLIREIQPTEIYNLAAQSHVMVSFTMPQYTAQVDAVGTVAILEAIRATKRDIRLPPISSAEAGFLNLRHDADIQERLLQITHAKHQDVSAQISSQPSLNLHCPPVVVVADTTVVAGPQDGHREVLGQPDPTLQGADVRDWFLQLLSGKTHQVLTAVLVSRGNQLLSQIVTTEVEFLQLTERQVDWYLATGEPQGKAGGYAIQGLAAAFVKRVSGSLTCVIGLPLLETLRMIHDISHQQ